MGWASANSIFDRTAQALIHSGAGDYDITNVLVELIDALRDHDWDTLDESIEEFKDQPMVMAAFKQAVPDYFEDEDDVENTAFCNKLGWIAARLAWHGSDLVHLIERPGITKADLQEVRDHPMGDPKTKHIEMAVAEFREMFPDFKTLDDAKRKFGAGGA